MTMRGLTIRRTEIGSDWVTLAVEGEIDLATVDELDTDIKKFLQDEDGSLAIDLTGADFMDSTGLRCLVMSDRSFREAERGFALIVNGGPISRLIDLSGVDSEISIVAAPEDLVESR